MADEGVTGGVPGVPKDDLILRGLDRTETAVRDLANTVGQSHQALASEITQVAQSVGQLAQIVKDHVVGGVGSRERGGITWGQLLGTAAATIVGLAMMNLALIGPVSQRLDHEREQRADQIAQITATVASHESVEWHGDAGEMLRELDSTVIKNRSLAEREHRHVMDIIRMEVQYYDRLVTMIGKMAGLEIPMRDSWPEGPSIQGEGS